MEAVLPFASPLPSKAGALSRPEDLCCSGAKAGRMAPRASSPGEGIGDGGLPNADISRLTTAEQSLAESGTIDEEFCYVGVHALPHLFFVCIRRLRARTRGAWGGVRAAGLAAAMLLLGCFTSSGSLTAFVLSSFSGVCGGLASADSGLRTHTARNMSS